MHLMRKDLATIFGLRGEAFGLPDPAIDFSASLEFIATDQRRWKKLVARSKLAYTSHFVLTALGNHWSLDMMLLADCYHVLRLGVHLDLLGYVAPAVAAPSYRCWCSFVSASFAGLVTHSTHKHGFRRTAYNYVTEFGDCFGCLKTFIRNEHCWTI